MSDQSSTKSEVDCTALESVRQWIQQKLGTNIEIVNDDGDDAKAVAVTPTGFIVAELHLFRYRGDWRIGSCGQPNAPWVELQNNWDSQRLISSTHPHAAKP